MDKTHPKFKHKVNVSGIIGQLERIFDYSKQHAGADNGWDKINKNKSFHECATIAIRFQSEMGWLNNNILEAILMQKAN